MNTLLTLTHYCFLSALTAASLAAAPSPAPLGPPGGPVVALWQKEPSPNKPYISQLFAPGEKPVPILADSPPDHFHHHGLMFALSVDDTDFWAEKGVPNAGRQDVVESIAAPAGGGFTQRLRWLAANGNALVEETRQVRVRAEGPGINTVHWLDWESTLTPSAGRDRVRLSGAHYFGLGMRFSKEWANQAEFIWSDPSSPSAAGAEKVTTGDWCAVRCNIGGRPLTVLMLAHPSNPRPGEWFTMGKPFCYLSATLNLKNRPFTLAKGERWTLRYGIAVLSTPADHGRLESLAATWRNINPLTAPQPLTPEEP